MGKAQVKDVIFSLVANRDVRLNRVENSVQGQIVREFWNSPSPALMVTL